MYSGVFAGAQNLGSQAVPPLITFLCLPGRILSHQLLSPVNLMLPRYSFPACAARQRPSLDKWRMEVSCWCPIPACPHLWLAPPSCMVSRWPGLLLTSSSTIVSHSEDWGTLGSPTHCRLSSKLMGKGDVRLDVQPLTSTQCICPVTGGREPSLWDSVFALEHCYTKKNMVNRWKMPLGGQGHRRMEKSLHFVPMALSLLSEQEVLHFHFAPENNLAGPMLNLWTPSTSPSCVGDCRGTRPTFPSCHHLTATAPHPNSAVSSVRCFLKTALPRPYRWRAGPGLLCFWASLSYKENTFLGSHFLCHIFWCCQSKIW